MIDLSNLSHLEALFKRFNSGAHLNRLKETELWFELEKNQEAYQSIFTALGYFLVLDSRGFAYFKTDQSTSNTSKLTRRLALLIMLIFEFQADRGVHLFQFQQWLIDDELISSIWQNYKTILEAEDLNDLSAIKDTFDSAIRIGFVDVDSGIYSLLPAVYRYLDLFEELAQPETSDETEGKEEML